MKLFKGTLLTCDAPVKQLILAIDETEKCVIQDLDETHLLVQTSSVDRLKEKLEAEVSMTGTYHRRTSHVPSSSRRIRGSLLTRSHSIQKLSRCHAEASFLRRSCPRSFWKLIHTRCIPLFDLYLEAGSRLSKIIFLPKSFVLAIGSLDCASSANPKSAQDGGAEE